MKDRKCQLKTKWLTQIKKQIKNRRRRNDHFYPENYDLDPNSVRLPACAKWTPRVSASWSQVHGEGREEEAIRVRGPRATCQVGVLEPQREGGREENIEPFTVVWERKKIKMYPAHQLNQKKKTWVCCLKILGFLSFSKLLFWLNFQKIMYTDYNYQWLFYVILLSYCSQLLETNMQPLRGMEQHQQAEKKRFLGKQKKKRPRAHKRTTVGRDRNKTLGKQMGERVPQGGVPGEGGQAGDGRGGSRKLGCSTTLRFLTSWSILSDLFWSFWWLWRRSGQPAKEKPAWTKQSLQTRLVCVFWNDPLSCPNWQESLVCFTDYFAESQLMNFSPSPRAPTRQRMQKVIDKPKNRVPCSVSSVTCRAKLWARTLRANFASSASVCSGSLSCWCCSCLLGPVAPPLVSRRCSRPCSFIFCSMSSCLHFFNMKKTFFFFCTCSFFHYFIFPFFPLPCAFQSQLWLRASVSQPPCQRPGGSQGKD